MTITLTRLSDTTTSTPDDLLGYSARNESGTVVTDLIDGSIAVTLLDAQPRTGSLRLRYLAYADAWAAHAMHLLADTYTLADSDRPALDMTYIRKSVDIDLEETTWTSWIVTVEYQEIIP